MSLLISQFVEAWKQVVPDQAMPASREEARKILLGVEAGRGAPALALLGKVDEGAYKDALDSGAAYLSYVETRLAGESVGPVSTEGRHAVHAASGKRVLGEGETARLGPGLHVGFLGASPTEALLPPPPFPTAADLASPKNDAAMPAAAVEMVKKMMTGEMHARWHTTRDFAFTMEELDPKSTDPKTQAVLSTWKALREAKMGVPAPKPPAGTKVDPKQTAFIQAMNDFAKANPNSPDPNTSDVVSTWQQIQDQNWPIPARQEGDPGNGLDFLTMHHEMVLMMKNMLGPMTKHMSEADQQTLRALYGWSQFPMPAPWPYDPKDSAAGVASATTAVNLLNQMLQASTPAAVAELKKEFQVVTGLAFDNASPDQFGLWIQSSASGLPNSGIHNWMHNEYEIPNSPTEMDSFVLNVQNPHFWGLHGTIDNAFMKFLSLRGMSVDNPAVKAALAEQAAEMGMRVQPEHGGPMPMEKGTGAPSRNAQGAAVTPDGSLLRPFDDMSPGLRAVIDHAQRHAILRGMMS